MENNNLKRTIGKRINSLLAEQNKTQKELADTLGVKPNVISYFCSGARTPNTDQIVKIADYFNVSADYLLGIQEAKTRDKDVVFICEYTGLSDSVVKKLNWDLCVPHKAKLIKTLNWLMESGYIYDLVSELCNLQNKSSRYMKSKNGEAVAIRRNEPLQCDVIRLNLFRLIEHLSDQFDERRQVNEYGEYPPPKE